MRLHYMVWLGISCCFFTAGEILSKLLANSFSRWLVVAVCLSSVLWSLTWLPAIMQKNQLAVVGTTWSVLSLVTTVLIGTVIFNECLCRDKVIGIALAAIAVYLLAK